MGKHATFLLISLIILITPTSGWKERIDSDFLNKIEKESSSGTLWDIMVEFKKPSTTTLDASTAGLEPGPRRSFIVRKILMEEAEMTQGEVIRMIKRNEPRGGGGGGGRSNNEEIRSIWITNELFIPSASSGLIFSLAKYEVQGSSNISIIREHFEFPGQQQPIVQTRRQPLPGEEGRGGDWNINITRVRPWWAKGYNGSGVIIGHIDTGAFVGHQELNSSWAGKPWGWLFPRNEKYVFPIETFPGYINPESTGTHTLGIIVGKNTGIAPGARWTSCLPCPGDKCQESRIKECGAFMLCPTTSNGQCLYRPSVIYNYWSKEFRKASNIHTFDALIQTWRKEGIIPVFGSGTDHFSGAGLIGAKCGSIFSPADHEDVITVGFSGLTFASYDDPVNRTLLNDLRGYSALGPPSDRYPDFAARNIIKPDIIGPGAFINSCSALDNNPRRYGQFSGTEAGAAHVVGAIALILSRTANLTFDKIKNILIKSANTSEFRYHYLVNKERCGDKDNTTIPNYKVGYGFLQLPDPDDSSILIDPPKAPNSPMPPPPDYTGYNPNGTDNPIDPNGGMHLEQVELKTAVLIITVTSHYYFFLA